MPGMHYTPYLQPCHGANFIVTIMFACVEPQNRVLKVWQRSQNKDKAEVEFQLKLLYSAHPSEGQWRSKALVLAFSTLLRCVLLGLSTVRNSLLIYRFSPFPVN